MAADLSSLQTAVSDLQGVVTTMKPVLDASVALGTRAIAALESLSGQVAALQPDAAAIAALSTSISDTVTALRADQAEVATGNAAVQTELDKVAPVPPTAG